MAKELGKPKALSRRSEVGKTKCRQTKINQWTKSKQVKNKGAL